MSPPQNKELEVMESWAGPGNEARLNVRSMKSIGILYWCVSPVWYMWAPLYQCSYHPAKGQQALVDVARLPGTFVYSTGATNVLTSCKIHLQSHVHIYTASTACLNIHVHLCCTHPMFPFSSLAEHLLTIVSSSLLAWNFLRSCPLLWHKMVDKNEM